MDNKDEQDDVLRAIYIGQLLFRQADGQPIDDVERAELDAWRQSDPRRAKLFDETLDRHAIAQELRELDGRYDTERSEDMVFRALDIPHRNERTLLVRLRRWVPAAVFILLLGVGGWLLVSRQEIHPSVRTSAVARQQDIPPGSNKAILTLASGEKLVLDSGRNGQIAQQGDVHIMNRNGQLSYAGAGAGTGTGTGTDRTVLFNTVATPKGGQYQLLLPDGSRVWLNAASSIQFPTAFTGEQRKVILTGEAYFDIAKDKTHPFIVETKGQRIAVLGTEFDVMAYEDEDAQRTTLLRGAIAVIKGDQKRVLAPGQQAILQPDKPITVDANANVEKVTAWKTGFFMFNNTNIKTLMREIARWYDIDVEYKITDYSGTYGGSISRNSSLKRLKELLEGNGIYHYKIEGRKLTVLP